MVGTKQFHLKICYSNKIASCLALAFVNAWLLIGSAKTGTPSHNHP